jgi:hypothetical protein
MKEPRPRLSFPVSVTLLYCIGGGVWVLFSDQIMQALTQDRETLARIKSIEDWLFIAATALILYLALRKESGTREKAEQ